MILPAKYLKPFSIILLFLLIVPTAVYVSNKAKMVKLQLEETVRLSILPNSELLEFHSGSQFSANVTASYLVDDVDVYEHYCRFFESQEGWYRARLGNTRKPSGECNSPQGAKSREMYSLLFCKKKFTSLTVKVYKKDEGFKVIVSTIWKPGTVYPRCKI